VCDGGIAVVIGSRAEAIERGSPNRPGAANALETAGINMKQAGPTRSRQDNEAGTRGTARRLFY